MRGDLHHKLRELHDQYGKVVRTAPDELSSVDGSAWQSITAGGNHNQGLPKNPVIFGAQEFDSVFDHVGPAHSRLRRLLTQTFSGPILREQEPLLAEAVNKFAEKLRGFAKVGATVNMLEWFNYLSFDITGEITFSETFNQLDDERYHPWVDLIINHIKYSALAIGLRYFPPLDRIMPLLAPKRLKDLRYRFLFLAREKVMRRLHRDPKTLKHRDTFSICYSNLPGDVTQEELIGTFTFLIIAGSETSGTVLTGILNYLLSNPRVFQRLKDEVRGACSAGEDLGLNQTAHLPYLNAVLKEGLRLCNPLATALSRVVPLGGAKISGYEIPAKVSMSRHRWHAFLFPLSLFFFSSLPFLLTYLRPLSGYLLLLQISQHRTLRPRLNSSLNVGFQAQARLWMIRQYIDHLVWGVTAVSARR